MGSRSGRVDFKDRIPRASRFTKPQPKEGPKFVFLVLNVREKLYTAFKALAGNRLDVDALLLKNKNLVIGYAIGNIFIGGILSVASIIIFWKVGLTPAVTLGVVSGFLNLIPFVGLILAVAVPVLPAWSSSTARRGF